MTAFFSVEIFFALKLFTNSINYTNQISLYLFVHFKVQKDAKLSILDGD